MDDEIVIKEIVEALFGDECLEIGVTNLDHLLRMEAPGTAPTRVAGGHDHDIAPALATIVAAIGLIREIISIYRELRSAPPHPTSIEITTIVERISARNVEGIELSNNTIVSAVVKKLDDTHDEPHTRRV